MILGRRLEGFTEALGDAAGALLPLSVQSLQRELRARLRRVPNEINEFGFDPYGMNPEWLARAALPALLLYRHYFRVETFDIDRVPSGRVLLVANHAGQLPFDGVMIILSLLLEAELPRLCRGMGEHWLPRLPWINVMLSRGGMLVGTPKNCTHMLENEECVLVFPEGARGMSKPFSERYRLQRFGLGFLRLALETRTPIIPVGVVGSEEQQPGLANLERLGSMFGLPSLPITLGFPWLGPLGLLPLPTRYRIYFGEPLHFSGEASDEDALVEERVGVVRNAIGELLQRGLREREGWFR